MRMRTVLVITAALTLSVAGCGGGARSSSSVPVVAAENVYGNIAAQIGGPHVSVTSILTNPNADPHLFAPGTATGLSVANAKVVIENGLGYDVFMTKLENAAPSKSRRVLTIARVLRISGPDANPHLWYDVPRLRTIAGAIASAFSAVDPPHRLAYEKGLVRFDDSLRPLEQEVASIHRNYSGAPVAYSEPVPGYLVAAAGLRNLAPTSFTRPIEEGTEPPPAAVAAMDALVADHRIRVLLYNSQAVSPITARLRTAAANAGIPVVPVSETLPPGLTFQQWQLGQARALAAALGKR